LSPWEFASTCVCKCCLFRHGEPSTEARRFHTQYPFPIYLIFNPYHSDEIHYVGDEHLINENLFHEWGPVFTGMSVTIMARCAYEYPLWCRAV
jgi:hypothetical protein